MKDDKKIKTINIISVVVSIIGLTIAFLAMSRTYIKTSGNNAMDKAKWDIHFKNVKFVSKSENASVSGSPTPSSNDTSITIDNLNAILKQPGDYVIYTADIENTGDFDAEIKYIILPMLTEREQELLDFNVEYTDKQETGTKKINFHDKLYKGETKNITITFRYKNIIDENLLPSFTEKISVSYSIEYTELNKKVNNVK